MSTKATQMPLCRLMSKRGIASRAQATAMALAGKVSVDGRIVDDPERWVGHKCIIEVDGEVTQTTAHRIFMMNKKRGVISSRADERGRRVVYDHPLLHDGRYAAVGRLDKASEGLMLFTNDSQLANRMTSPRSHIDKTYHVKIDRLLTAEELEFLAKSEDLDGELTKESVWATLRHGEKNSWLEVRLSEGKNRQIRRMLEKRGVAVARLIRVRLGDLELGTLAKGDVRELTAAEIDGLRA